MNKKSFFIDRNNDQSGIVALITAVVMVIFLFSVGMLMIIEGGTSIFSSQVGNQADQAQFLAETGIQDALIKLARDKNFTGSYTISESDPVLTVKKVDVNVATISGSTSVVIATSTITRGGSVVNRTIRADVIFDTSVGKEGKILSFTKTNL
ncbi:MAG: hypothetical protein QMD65_02435 [Patescibacteria group bacterium]|nr:hypothetical protein [Patescibacteria group bacterium]